MSRSMLSLIKLVTEVLANPALTPGYQPQKDIVNVLDGWTVPIALVLEHPSRDQVIHEIVQRRYTGPDLIVESVDIGIDLLSSLSHALDDFSIKQVVTHPIKDSPDEVEISRRAPQVVAEKFGDVKELFKFVRSRRTFNRTLVLPTSFPFFVNRFAVLRRPELSDDTKLEVLMQLFLYWCVMESSYHLGPQHQHSEKEWSELIAKHRNHEVYGEASFVAMRDWWFGHVEGKDGPLGQSIALRTLGSRPARQKQHELEDSFRSMVTSLTKFFDNVSKWLNHSTRFQAVSRQARGHRYIDADARGAQDDHPTELDY